MNEHEFVAAQADQRPLRIGEVAALTGVSIRTLRHYDQIGLLKPAARTESGYRLYSRNDLLRLQQALTLRYLGLPLRQITDLLARPDGDPVEALRAQRAALQARIVELERISTALTRLLEYRATKGHWDWDLVVTASAAAQEGLTSQERRQSMTPEERKRQFAELGNEITSEEIAAVEQGWAALLAEVRAHRDLDPASQRAQALAERWDALIQATFRGRQELMSAVAEGYGKGEYTHVDAAPQPEDFAFIERVRAARA